MLSRATVRPALAVVRERIAKPPSLLTSQVLFPSCSCSALLLRTGTRLHRRHLATANSTVGILRRWRSSDWSLVGLAGVGISCLLLGQTSMKKEPHDDPPEPEERTSFTVPVLSQTGAQSTKTLTLLTAEETNKRLKEHEASYSVSRRTNPVYRYDTNALSSNSPIEDDNCCVILERDPESKVQGDMMFWGVFDGHSGWQTSRRLSTDLVSYVARELDLVFRSSPQYASILQGKTSSSPLKSPSKSSFWSLVSASPSSPSPVSFTELDLHDDVLQQAIKNAFDRMDDEIVNAPVRLLEKTQRDGKWTKPKLEDDGMGTKQTEALNTLLPALSGSCALLAFLDAGRNKLHVACTGDSRAVMGTWEPSKGGGGKWRADVLSEDQTGKNVKEVKRMKSEHPASEAETVIARGRVLGGLEPTRAFGDARYKWPLGLQERLASAFHPGSVRGRPRNYLTPPYVKATPELVTVDLSKSPSPTRKSLASFMPVSSTVDPVPPQATRFIVLATDGLYDRLNNDEIVSLVGAHLSGVRGNQSRSTTLSHVSSSSSHASFNPASQAHAPRQEPQRGEGDVFTFEDGNLATHLIRNALGGAKREQVNVLLSIPAPLSRRYRDDITATIILLGDVGPGGERGTGGVQRRDADAELSSPPKAKL